MAETIQQIRKIGGCENMQAQLASQRQEAGVLTPCPAQAAFLCEVCGFLLCGSHAGGHRHAAGDFMGLPSALAGRLAQTETELASANANAVSLQKQLGSAEKRLTAAAEAQRLLEEA